MASSPSPSAAALGIHTTTPAISLSSNPPSYTNSPMLFPYRPGGHTPGGMLPPDVASLPPFALHPPNFDAGGLFSPMHGFAHQSEGFHPDHVMFSMGHQVPFSGRSTLTPLAEDAKALLGSLSRPSSVPPLLNPFHASQSDLGGGFSFASMFYPKLEQPSFTSSASVSTTVSASSRNKGLPKPPSRSSASPTAAAVNKSSSARGKKSSASSAKRRKTQSDDGISSTSRSRRPSSKYRGVSRCSKDGRWQARIRVSKIVTYLGRFASEEEAARKYDAAAREHHGDKAILNFPDHDDFDRGRKLALPPAVGQDVREVGVRKSSRPAKPKRLMPDEVEDINFDDEDLSSDGSSVAPASRNRARQGRGNNNDVNSDGDDDHNDDDDDDDDDNASGDGNDEAY